MDIIFERYKIYHLSRFMGICGIVCAECLIILEKYMQVKGVNVNDLSQVNFYLHGKYYSICTLD